MRMDVEANTSKCMSWSHFVFKWSFSVNLCHFKQNMVLSDGISI